MHAINAVPFANLNAGADFTQTVVVSFERKFMMRREVNHDFIVLAFLDGFQGIGKVQFRKRLHNRSGNIQRLAFQQPQHAFKDIKQPGSAGINYTSLFENRQQFGGAFDALITGSDNCD